MKRICFGTLFVLMYQARGQGVKNEQLCNAILASFDADMSYRDASLPGHLKNGHTKVPRDIVDSVRNCDTEKAVDAFRADVMSLIQRSMRTPLLSAVLDILTEDSSFASDTQISWIKGYTKQVVLEASAINLTYLLTSLVRFSVLEIDNEACKDGIREIPGDFVKSFVGKEATVKIDEQSTIIRWPDGEIKSSVSRRYLSNQEILSDVDTLKKMLSRYKRPDPLPIPVQIDNSEMVYVKALYDAYASAEGVHVYKNIDVDRTNKYKKDFAYQRKCYYAAETIRRSLQDALLPVEYKEFDEMQEEVKDGIYPKLLPHYDNGYLRLCAVTGHAVTLPISRSQIALLPGWIGAAEKVGMCHMLANKKEIQWVDEDD